MASPFPFFAMQARQAQWRVAFSQSKTIIKISKDSGALHHESASSQSEQEIGLRKRVLGPITDQAIWMYSTKAPLRNQNAQRDSKSGLLFAAALSVSLTSCDFDKPVTTAAREGRSLASRSANHRKTANERFA